MWGRVRNLFRFPFAEETSYSWDSCSSCSKNLFHWKYFLSLLLFSWQEEEENFSMRHQWQKLFWWLLDILLYAHKKSVNLASQGFVITITHGLWCHLLVNEHWPKKQASLPRPNPGVMDVSLKILLLWELALGFSLPVPYFLMWERKEDFTWIGHWQPWV